MIPISQETLLTFAEAAKRLPRRRLGRPVHVSTIHRWRTTGVLGVRLEAIRVGGAWHTSVEALQRFGERLSLATDKRAAAPEATQLSAAAEAAGRQLKDRYGV